VGSAKEQTICVKLYFKEGKTAAESHTMLHGAYGNDVMSHGDL
jgi:hypothetical protein